MVNEIMYFYISASILVSIIPFYMGSTVLSWFGLKKKIALRFAVGTLIQHLMYIVCYYITKAIGLDIKYYIAVVASLMLVFCAYGMVTTGYERELKFFKTDYNLAKLIFISVLTKMSEIIIDSLFGREAILAFINKYAKGYKIFFDSICHSDAFTGKNIHRIYLVSFSVLLVTLVLFVAEFIFDPKLKEEEDDFNDIDY